MSKLVPPALATWPVTSEKKFSWSKSAPNEPAMKVAMDVPLRRRGYAYALNAQRAARRRRVARLSPAGAMDRGDGLAELRRVTAVKRSGDSMGRGMSRWIGVLAAVALAACS